MVDTQKTKQKSGNKGKEEISKIYVESGVRILNCRHKKKMTRDTLASAAGISSKFLYEIETGHTGYSVAVLEKIAEALGVECDYILFGQVNRPHYDQDLVSALAAFDEEGLQKVARVLNIIAEFH
ncbi:MAG: helix-turn-helix transcriptional regulator [Lachnospiraceae bacterium]|nr:helix-turn-helix transcriptional regulator [Lachnospiraceae bacterium]MBO5146725.1 helix-turn-helix transcriptional regulator [Lachnospiraceae bacterium]